MRWLYFICGTEKLSVDACYRTQFINLCMREQIEYRSFRVADDGSVSFLTTMRAAKRLRHACALCEIPIQTVLRGGLPWLAIRYRQRVGLILGAMIALFLLYEARLFVWDVRISGNEQLSREEVLEELRACDFGVGSYIPSIRNEVLENRITLHSDRIAWIAIHMDGTVAVVQVIERVDAPAEEDRSRPANLIAVADGQIERLEILRGNCAVKVGQAVKKGELLVGGIYDSQTEGYRYTRAFGKVFARTERVFSVEIPLKYTEKCYDEEKCQEIDLNFFGFSIKIFKNSGNLPMECDIIKKNKAIEPLGVANVPIGWTVTSVVTYRIEERQRTATEALDAAYAELAVMMEALPTEIELLQKDIQTEITEDGVRLICVMTCLENIAMQVEFEVAE